MKDIYNIVSGYLYEYLTYVRDVIIDLGYHKVGYSLNTINKEIVILSYP
jgi:hypothetical protein